MARPRPQKRERDDPRSGQLPLPDLRFGLKPPRKRVLLVPIPHVVIRRRQLSSRPVLHPAAGGEPLDADSFSADCRAHRATRMAPHVIEKAGHGGRGKRSALGGTISGRKGAEGKTSEDAASGFPASLATPV